MKRWSLDKESTRQNRTRIESTSSTLPFRPFLLLPFCFFFHDFSSDIEDRVLVFKADRRRSFAELFFSLSLSLSLSFFCLPSFGVCRRFNGARRRPFDPFFFPSDRETQNPSQTNKNAFRGSLWEPRALKDTIACGSHHRRRPFEPKVEKKNRPHYMQKPSKFLPFFHRLHWLFYWIALSLLDFTWFY